MNRIGALSIPDASILKSIVTDWALTPSKRGYVAPTVYTLKGKVITGGRNYYDTLDKAFSKLKYLFAEQGVNETPAGSIKFNPDGTAQTMGLNCDYYFVVSRDKLVNVPYSIVKLALQKGIAFNMVFRFYTVSGAGPYYAIFEPGSFGIAATETKAYSNDKLAAMDSLYREVNLIKANYNGLVSMLNSLAAKPSLTDGEQQIYNRGNNLRISMMQEISLNKSIEVSYKKDGSIGLLFLAPIAWFAIAAIVTAWSVSKIVEAVQNTKRINSSYSFIQWKTAEEKNIALLEQQGKISKGNADQLRIGLNQASVAAGEVIKEASEDKSMFGEIGDALKWGVLLFAAITILPKLGGAKS